MGVLSSAVSRGRQYLWGGLLVTGTSSKCVDQLKTLEAPPLKYRTLFWLLRFLLSTWFTEKSFLTK